MGICCVAKSEKLKSKDFFLKYNTYKTIFMEIAFCIPDKYSKTQKRYLLPGQILVT